MNDPKTTSISVDYAKRAACLLHAIRVRRPRVHCLTNTIAESLTANGLLAIGAVPSLTQSLEEVADFVASADALLVNLGTLDVRRREVIDVAVSVAIGADLPWVLDPVFIDRSPGRLHFAHRLLRSAPSVIRANAVEWTALNTSDILVPERTARAMTGAIDTLAQGVRCLEIANGTPDLAQVAATGCLAGALIAAFAVVEADPFIAAGAALGVLGIAGERAAEQASGPGSFAVALLDALATLDSAALAADLKMTYVTANEHNDESA